MNAYQRPGVAFPLGRVLLGSIVGLKHFLIRGPLARHKWLLTFPRLLYRKLLARLVARTGLFDPDYYLANNPDVDAAGWDPLRHYVACGDHEGRKPMPLFDPTYYRDQAGAMVPINSLLHYAWIGRQRLAAPCAWFDPRFYLQQYPEVGATGADPLDHYLTVGGLEGRSPCPAFDGPAYLEANPEVVQRRINPLTHYLARGHGAVSPGEGDAGRLPPVAVMPNDAAWDEVQGRADHASAEVDVVVPVYRGRAETLGCLLSVLRAPVRADYALIVIDDSSPDAALSADLRRLAERGLFTLLVNDRNLGFVRTTNRGMRLHADRDVVLLNADAEVFGDWLDRLRDVTRRDPRAGTVTPLSNSATICSYPRFVRDNPQPLEIDPAGLDRLAAEHNQGVAVESPTGHGFCIYLRRACLDEVGLFDEDAFGRGYGEENDLCQRALRRRWKSLLAADVFVRHWGSTSFGGEKKARSEAAMRVVVKRHPRYNHDITRFIAADPLAAARRTLDLQRLKRYAQARNVLFVCHARGGGTERQVREEIRQIGGEGDGAFLLRPNAALPGRVVLSHPAVSSTPNLAGLELSDTGAVAALCRALDIGEIRVHSLVDFPPEASAQIVRLADALQVRVAVHVHDYEAICPRLTLSDEQGRYCGEPDPSGCNLCLRRRGAEFAVKRIGPWRESRELLLRRADRIVVPDADVAERLLRYFPGLGIDVVPHEAPQALAPPSHAIARGAGPLRIVIVGAISLQKGYHIIRECAAHARRLRQPLQFILMGYSRDDAGLVASGVQVAGRYADEQADATLAALRPDAVWIPSTWPETYSFTLSLALRAGVPVFAFDLGAVGRRLRECGADECLLPRSAMGDPQAVNALFLRALAPASAAA